MTDALQEMKEKVAEARAQIAELNRYAEDLMVGVAAMEAKRIREPHEAAPPVKQKRGAVQKTILDALRGKALKVSELVIILSAQGIDTNASRVSAALNTLREKKQVQGGVDAKWSRVDNSSEDQNAKSPPASAERLLHTNGAASLQA